MSFWYQPTFKSNFASGFGKYVVTTLQLKPPPPDFFWNPRVGQWSYLDPQRYRFIDENLPAIGEVTRTSNAEAIFDEITQQWSGLAAPAHQSAVWDGHEHKWILAEPVGTSGGGGKGGDDKAAARTEYERKLGVLKQQHEQHLLSDQEYERQVEDLWNEYKDRI